MIEDKHYVSAIKDMIKDITSTNTFNYIDPNSEFTYYISINTNDYNGLVRAVKVLKDIGITAKNILMIPKSYKTSGFDCIDINELMSSMKSNLYNIECISIIEKDNYLKDGDFVISIIKENRNTNYTNIMSYGPLY